MQEPGLYNDSRRIQHVNTSGEHRVNSSKKEAVISGNRASIQNTTSELEVIMSDGEST